jgi:hypothetical protein
MIKKVLFGMAMLLMFCETVPAQYPGWEYSDSVFLITTPEGANLPASASVEGIPLLVRLHKDYFDFSQTTPRRALRSAMSRSRYDRKMPRNRSGNLVSVNTEMQ